MNRITSLFFATGVGLLAGCAQMSGPAAAPAAPVAVQTPPPPAPAPAPAAMPAPAPARRPMARARLSPHETISAKIDGKYVIIVYGRPYSKDPHTGEKRVIWGTLVPYGKVWRLGADEATLLVVQQEIMLGGVAIPAGAYTLDLLPAADGSAKLIVNKDVGQWGIPYTQQADELARIDLQKDSLDTSVDQFTMTIGKNPAGGGVIRMMWENTRYSVGYSVVK